MNKDYVVRRRGGFSARKRTRCGSLLRFRVFSVTYRYRTVCRVPRSSPLLRSSRSVGFSLVELLVATMLLTIVFVGWLTICNFQPIRKEALRRLAVEQAAGYLDFLAASGASVKSGYFYRVSFEHGVYSYDSSTPDTSGCWPWPMFDSKDSIGYTIDVVKPHDTGFPGHTGAWVEEGGHSFNWAVIRLYDRHSCGLALLAAREEKPFSTMSILMQ